ncbi:MAG TPA: carboxylating nicotinate-nucleotide diphosphorylase [Candidatus Dormibacteraeota bacterium]|nr:carboxylating nicotinate-nucleotide diphosphorylase [Candidatus Dormibacteraeota bacterium]
MASLDPAEIEAAVERALAEDYRGTDLSGEAVLDEGQRGVAEVISREPGVLCGVAIAQEVFRQVDNSVECAELLLDGARLQEGSVAMRVAGPARSLLAAERTAVNFLQHLSGIASLTAQFVRVASPFGVDILDTRKTLPGLRLLEKYAARTGGARNHRMGLFDAILIKDNHVDLAGGVSQALARAAAHHPAKAIEIEVRTEAELEQAVERGVGRVLLDNFTPEAVRAAVAWVGNRAEVEVSGGVTLENLAAYAQARPNYISVGRITHSAPALDLAMKVIAQG